MMAETSQREHAVRGAYSAHKIWSMAHPLQAGSLFGIVPDVLAHLPAIVFATDVEGQIVIWTGAGGAGLGYSAGELLSQSLEILFPPKQASEMLNSFLEQVRSRGEFSGKLTWVRKNGSDAALEVTARLVRTRQGGPVSVVGMGRELPARPERAKSGAMLPLPQTASEHAGMLDLEYVKLETVLRQFPVGMIIIDPNTEQVLFRNEAATRFWHGVERPPSPTEVARFYVGRDRHGNIMKPEDWPVMRTLRTGETVLSEEVQLMKSPSESVFVRVNSGAVRDREGHVFAVALTFEDITQQKQMEWELQESETRFRQLTENIEEVFWMLDPRSQEILYVSPAFERIWGRSCEELRSRPEILLESVHADDRARVWGGLERQRNGGQVDMEYRIVRPDGSTRWISDRAFPIRNSEGTLIRIAGIATDITDRKRAEDMLRQTERLATAGRMAAAIAHEINNPLESVTNLLYLLARDSSLGPSAREYANLAQQEIARVAQVARQTLAFYRESSSPAWLSLPQLLESVLTLYSPRIESRGIQVRKDFSATQHIHALAGELRQVFSNLLVNALDATPARGRVHVRVCDAMDRRRKIPGLRVIIADSGGGIPKAVRQRIFEPFFSTKEDGGTGLGLWVVQEILAKRGGTIRMRSSTTPEHSGTCFSVFLPLEMAEEQQKS